MTPLTTVIVGPRCRLTEVPPALASNAATSRSAPLRLFTNSRPATSTGRCVSPGADALAATGTATEGPAPDGPSRLVVPLLAFGVCCSVWPGLTTFSLAELSAGSLAGLSAGTSRTTAGASWAPPVAGGVEGADCGGRDKARGGSAAVSDRVAGAVEATSGGAGCDGRSRVRSTEGTQR
jgi:hypothetical protein